MKKLAKILVLVLSVALVFGAIAMAVSAENETCKIGDASYATLAEALAAAQTGETITLAADISVDASITLNGVNLDLGGYKVTGTGAGALFVTNGNVTIANGSVESAYKLLFDVQSGELTVNTLSGFASLPGTNYQGVSSLPECYTVAEGASFVNADDSDVKVRALYQVNHSNGTVTYFGTADEFTYALSYKESDSAGYYVIQNGDTIVMNGDITLTKNLSNDFNWSVHGVTFEYTLDINGYTLDTNGWDIFTTGEIFEDKNSNGTKESDESYDRDYNVTFNLTSSKVGGVINCFYYTASSGNAGEGVYGNCLINTLCSNKKINIIGEVSGVETLTVNAASLYRNTVMGSTDSPNTEFKIIGGVYNMVAMSSEGFINLDSTVFKSKLTSNLSDVIIRSATFVQAYYSPKSTNGLHGQLDINDGGSSVNYCIPELFYFGGAKGASNYVEDQLYSTYINVYDSTIIGKTPDSAIVTARVTTGQVTFDNCVISADVAPKDAEYTDGNKVSYDYSGRGRVVLTNGTTFTTCSKEIKPYDGVTVQGGVFYGPNETSVAGSDKNIALPEIPSPIDREGAIAILRPWVIGGCDNSNKGNYGVYNPRAGYYFLVENGTSADSIVTDSDIAASYTYNGVTETTGNQNTRLVITLGIEKYKIITTEEYDNALFYIKHTDGRYSVYNSFDDWKEVFTRHLSATALTFYATKPDEMGGDITQYLVDLNGDGKKNAADYLMLPLDPPEVDNGSGKLQYQRYNSWLKEGDTVILNKDIVYDSKLAGDLPMMAISIDLNGHTIDASASEATFMALGGAGNGAQGGNHNDSISLTVCSSVPGGKIITCPGNHTAFETIGKGKTLTINAKDSDGNATLTIETTRLFRQQANASSGSTVNGSNTVLTVNGGNYVVNGTCNNALIEMVTTDCKAGSRYNFGQIILNDATIVNDGPSWITRVWYSSKLEAETAKMGGSVTFNNCDITMNDEASRFAAADAMTNSININNTTITGYGIGTANGGQVVIGEGCKFNGFKVNASAYNADVVGKPNQKGFYFGAAGLNAIKTVGETKYTVSNAEAKQVTWTLGETVTSNWYLADADVTADFPKAPTIYNNEIVTQSFEWVTESENNYVGKTTTAYANYNLSVSTTLYSNLAINVYLSEAYAKNYAGELDFVPSDEEGIWVATVALNGNEAFTAVVDSLSFATADGFKVTLTLNNPINLYNYVGMIISDEDMSVEERDLMWYMVDYLKNAYKVITLSEKEIAALGAEDEATAKATADSKFAELLALYEKRDITVSAEAYAGEALGVDIFVDLTSAPRFVFKASEGSTVTAVSVNGIALEANERGEFFFEIENVHQFDQTFTVTTDLSNESTASVKLANYYAKALAEDTEENFVAETVEALYKYVLAAQTFKASLTPSAE